MRFIRRSSTHGPFFVDRPIWPTASLPAAAAAHDVLVGRLALLAGAVAERRHAPGRDRMAARRSSCPRRRRAGGRPGSSRCRASAAGCPCGGCGPALPIVTFSWSALPIVPIVARQSAGTMRISPEGRRSVACGPPSRRAGSRRRPSGPSWPPRPGVISTLWTTVPVGIRPAAGELPTWISAPSPEHDLHADRQPLGREDVALLAVAVVQQRDVGACGWGRTRSRRPSPARRPCGA